MLVAFSAPGPQSRETAHRHMASRPGREEFDPLRRTTWLGQNDFVADNSNGDEEAIGLEPRMREPGNQGVQFATALDRVY